MCIHVPCSVKNYVRYLPTFPKKDVEFLPLSYNLSAYNLFKFINNCEKSFRHRHNF